MNEQKKSENIQKYSETFIKWKDRELFGYFFETFTNLHEWIHEWNQMEEIINNFNGLIEESCELLKIHCVFTVFMN